MMTIADMIDELIAYSETMGEDTHVAIVFDDEGEAAVFAGELQSGFAVARGDQLSRLIGVHRIVDDADDHDDAIRCLCVWRVPTTERI